MLHMHTCNCNFCTGQAVHCFAVACSWADLEGEVSTDGRDNALGWIRHVYACTPTWVLKNSKAEAGRITDTRPKI